MKKVSEKERQSFTFYLSFYKAIKGLKTRERLAIYDAIVEYSLLGKEPAALSPISQLVWDLIEPTLSKSRVKFLNACKTPHPTKQQAMAEQQEEHLAPSERVSEDGSKQVSTDTYTETETNTNTNTDTNTDKDKDTKRDTNTNKDTKSETSVQSEGQNHEPRPRRRSDSPPSKSAKALIDEYLQKIRSDTMRSAIGEWFEYKRERGEAYRTLHSMQLFCLKLKELADGNEYRAQKILQNSIANNWSGIFPLNDGYVPRAQRGEGYQRGYC